MIAAHTNFTHNQKPRLRRALGMWRCARPGESLSGFGLTPGAAYRSWQFQCRMKELPLPRAWPDVSAPWDQHPREVWYQTDPYAPPFQVTCQ